MHVVSDLQQRPRKSRLPTEKRIARFYDLCSVVQLTCFLVYTVTVVVLSGQTFDNGIFRHSSFALVHPLQAKLRMCTYKTTRALYAFSNVSVELNPQNVNDVFVDQAIQVRLGVFVGATALVLGVINRAMVEQNFFKLKYHNLYLWKDLISAMELTMLAYLCQIATAAHTPASLLGDYLAACNVHMRNYLPFMNSACLWTIAGVGFFSYLVGLVVYLCLSLPKYGIMSSNEIAEYKTWLRERHARAEHSRALLEEAKRAHARWQWANFVSSSRAAGLGENGLQGANYAKHSFLPYEDVPLKAGAGNLPLRQGQYDLSFPPSARPVASANLSFDSSQPAVMNYYTPSEQQQQQMLYSTRAAPAGQNQHTFVASGSGYPGSSVSTMRRRVLHDESNVMGNDSSHAKMSEARTVVDLASFAPSHTADWHSSASQH